MSKEKRRGSDLPATAADEATAFATRRKVIKGLASTVPVALTLSNGAAMADASSHQCLTKQDSIPGINPPDCSDDVNDLEGWEHSAEKIKPNSSGGGPKYCVAYADEPTPGNLQITGYNYSHTTGQGTTYTFIDQDGNTVSGGPLGNPLTTSCGGSFI